MKGSKLTNTVLTTFMLSVLCISQSCSVQRNTTWNENRTSNDSFIIKEGIVSTSKHIIKYVREGKSVATIHLDNPVIVSMADKEEVWGYYQFPIIGRADDGTLVVSWSMKSDSYKTVGIKSDEDYSPMMSKDGGKSWYQQDVKYFAPQQGGYSVSLGNGLFLSIKNPMTKAISDYTSFPKVVAKKRNYCFYPVEELPDDFQGAYLSKRDLNTGKTSLVHAKIHDPGSLRPAIDGLMPVIWRGNIKQLDDGSLLAGVYSVYYSDGKGGVLPGAIGFYRSTDNGNNWNIQGHIPYDIDERIDSLTEKERIVGFSEPAYEVLDNGRLICVMRSGSPSPLYQSFSNDSGKKWTKPQPIAPSGVKPQLLKLRNGVLVLASGRPGIQIRFSLDGTGERWTDPIDLMHFIREDGSYDTDVSCGYPCLLSVDDNTFYIVYSSFREHDRRGNERKAILFRKVQIFVN